MCYTTSMVWRHLHPRVRAALFAVLAALFVAVPALDAMACGADGVSAEASTQIENGAPGHADADRDVHGLCAHGHCHPGGADVPRGSGVPAALELTAEARLPARTTPPHSTAPNNLERPPKPITRTV
jgi:hypothetical protein